MQNFKRYQLVKKYQTFDLSQRSYSHFTYSPKNTKNGNNSAPLTRISIIHPPLERALKIAQEGG
jgi:hypothetical protein